jgi:hypothetical protein
MYLQKVTRKSFLLRKQQDPDPLVRGMDPRIRIQPKMSWIRNTACNANDWRCVFGQLPDYENPVVLQNDKCTVEDFCNKIHRTIIKELKFALVWGSRLETRTY